MRWSAVSGSALVHMAGVVAALISTQPRILYARSMGGPDAIAPIEPPQIYLGSGQVPRPGYGQAAGRLASAGDLGCPRQRPLDLVAAPDFPILGPEGPFAQAGKTRQSPAFCVLIGVDGRVSALTLAMTSGDGGADRALRRTIRRLAFHPAVRGGHAVAAWHRLVVNRDDDWPGAYDVVVGPRLEPVPPPPPELKALPHDDMPATPPPEPQVTLPPRIPTLTD